MAVSRLCSIDDCRNPVLARGWCVAHYYRWRRYGSTRAEVQVRQPRDPVCSVSGCNKTHAGRGLCNKHLKRLRTHGDPLKSATSPGEPVRYFREVVLHYEGDECLTWPFGARNGYGRLLFEGKKRTVSRLVCEEANGPAPTPGHEAAHSCGNGHLGCVTKRHLSWKTPVDNQADRVVHGTTYRGERHRSAKITEDQARAIYALKGKLSHQKIADQFGIARRTVGSIHSGRSWRWLTSP